MAENIRIGIKGEADFTQLENAAKQTADKLAQTLKGASVTGAFNPQEAHDFNSAIDKINRALKETGQAGRAFADIRFPTGQFAEVEKHLDNIKDRIEWMRRNSSFGRSIIKRAGEHGLSTEHPDQWTPEQFRRMYRDPRIADMNWQRFMGPGYQAGAQPPQPGPGHRSGALQGLAYGGQALGRHVVGQAGMGGALGLGLGARGAAAMAGGTALAATGIGAVVGGVAAAGAVLTKGYGEHLRTINSVDAQYKALGAKDGFGGLMDRTRDLGEALQMAQSDAAALGEQFMRTANSDDTESALTGAASAGQWARAMGLQPGQGVGLLGRAERAGIGDDEGERDAFKDLMAQTIEGSGMNAQALQLTEQMVEYLANIEQNLGREATLSEAENQAALLRALYGPNGAMSVGAASKITSSLSSLGTGKNAMDEVSATMAFGPMLGFDYAKMKLFMEQPWTATPNEVFGEGGDKTKIEMMMDYLQGALPTGLSDDPLRSMAAGFKDMGLGSMTDFLHAVKMLEEKRKQEAAGGEYSWRERIGEPTPADTSRSLTAGIANESADIAARAQPTIHAVKGLLLEALEGVEGFATAVEDAATELEMLGKAANFAWKMTGKMMGVFGTGPAGLMWDGVQSVRDAAPALGDGAVRAGGAALDFLIPPAEGSVNPTPYAINPGALGQPSASTNPIPTPEPQSSASTQSVIERITRNMPAVEQDTRRLRGGTLSNGCAAHTSSLLQRNGFDVKTELGAQNLVDQLLGKGWDKVPIGEQQAGDIGVTADWGAGLRGSDHVYTVMGTDPDDPNMLDIVDNQKPRGGKRPIVGGGKTTTEYFIRPPYRMQEFMRQFGADAGNWLSTGAMLPGMADLPREIQQQQKEQQERAEARQQAVSAAADVNVNISTAAADGSVNMQRYNLTVSEPLVAGSTRDRKTWNHDVTV
ncbi:hypothetical protein [Halochromatium roseum]|uniref:hypothetical protein n=1 Tax=Halochromatium roseum TaxID=391920 RepID=UPI0019141A49|nr:hypothetical protein [Halochromatium roseum]MBK5941418.1 hypothetical protein [Halochromatium roseum]